MTGAQGSAFTGHTLTRSAAHLDTPLSHAPLSHAPLSHVYLSGPARMVLLSLLSRPTSFGPFPLVYQDLVRGIAFMEAIVVPYDASTMGPISRGIFWLLKTAGVGERLILDYNYFIEFILPFTILRPVRFERTSQQWQHVCIEIRIIPLLTDACAAVNG